MRRHKKDARTAGTDPDALRCGVVRKRSERLTTPMQQRSKSLIWSSATAKHYSDIVHLFLRIVKSQKEGNEMAYMCTYGKNQECDGCLDCQQALCGNEDEEVEQPFYRCEECGDVAEEDGYYYDIEGLVLCSHCLDKRYRKEAS